MRVLSRSGTLYCHFVRVNSGLNDFTVMDGQKPRGTFKKKPCSLSLAGRDANNPVLKLRGGKNNKRPQQF